MSVIQTIRNKYGKIAGGVIAVALIGFIVSDARNGSIANFFGGHDSNVMVVNGTKIDPKEYQMRLKEFEILYSMFNKNQPLDDATRSQMNEQVVQMVVYETLVNEQCDKLGIITSDDEKKELIYGENADPIVRQFQYGGQQIFVNQQTGQFDPGVIKQFEKAITEDPQKNDPNGKLREQWNAVKSYVLGMSRINKFNSLFSGSVYIPTYSVKRIITDQNSMASIRYVKVPYTAVPDADVKVTDEEIKAYMQKHKAMFETDMPTRSMEYVSFDIVPSSADTARQIEALVGVKTEFGTTKENKTFVNNKSDEVNSYTEAYLNKRTYMSRFADTIMGLPVGEVYGPYFENGGYKLTKIVDRKTLPDSVKCRHILVKIKDRGNEVKTDSAAMMKIDSAIAEIEKGGNFDSVVARYSEDDGSNKKGGEYWFTLQQRPTISKEFGDFIFEGSVNEKKKVKVSNDNYTGYHYIQILEQKGTGPSVQLATITKNLAPSDSTVNAIYGKANEFAGKNPTAAEFDATVKKQNLNKRMGEHVKVNTFSITGLGSAREVIRWMYDHKVGEISGVFQLGDQRYIVAKLTAIEDKGVLSITAANRPMLEQKVKEEKKAEIIINKYKSSASLDAVAAASGVPAAQADTVVMGNASISGLGYEPKVVGYAFNAGFQPNTLSPGIKGQGGVYFISVLSRNVGQIDPKIMDMLVPQQRGSQEGQMRNSMGQLLQQNVIRKADVKYNANNF
jgi:peptidyl-prolyl cis-trans isomerase D